MVAVIAFSLFLDYFLYGLLSLGWRIFPPD
jgi:hypothetical protein